MESLELRGQIVDLLLGADTGWRRQAGKVFRFIDKLAVQLSVRIAADTATLRGGGSFADGPLRQGRRVQDVFVSAAHQDNRVVWSGSIKLPAMWEALLLQLPLVPIAVADDDLPRTRFRGAVANGIYYVLD